MTNDDDARSTLDAVKATLQSRSGGRRSPLFQWMYRHHDELAEMFAEARPNWSQITEVLTSRGFTGTEGQPLQPESVRKLWHKVRQAKEKTAGRKPKGKPVGAMPVPPVMVREVSPPVSSNLTPEQQAMMAELQQQMNKRSGR